MALSRITEVVTSFTDLTIGDDLTLTDDFLMASDASIIKFGADADVTLTHVHNTGLLLNSTSVIQFNDSSQNIGAPNATTLDINATDEIELNATLVDVNANLDVSGTYTGAGLMTTGGNIIIPNAGNIGSTSVTNAISISSGGVVAVTATTANTSASDGALTVGGGLGVAADVSIGDDLRLISDAAVLSFGADSDVTLTHVADTGILLNSTMAIQFNDASQFINAPSATVLDINATDEIELNATLVDANANLDVSGTYTGGGLMTTGGNIVIPDAGNIGSASDTDAIAIASNGQVTFTQTLIGTALDISGDIDVDGTTNLDVVDIDGAVDMASTLGVTGVVTANAGVVVDNITIDGTEIDLSSGDLTLDVAGDIILDADGAQVRFQDATTERFTFNLDATPEIDVAGGDFTIHTTTSDADFIVTGNDGGSGITAMTLDMSAAGAATFNNDVTAFSDERLKRDIETIPNALDKVCQMRGVTFERIDDEGRTSMGVIAQEIEKIIPEVVREDSSEDKIKSVAYGNMVGVLIEAIKELKSEIEELKKG